MGVVNVADVLRMPVLRGTGATVVAGRAGLSRPVRWVHSAELADIAPLLRSGDLLLSTGIALPGSAEGLESFAESVASSDVAGLLIELGRRWDHLPEALVDACDRLSLPLVALTREVRFAAVAQAVGERIVGEQLIQLREAEKVHETFTELGLAEAGPGDVLEAVQRLTGAAVVLESDEHRVIDYRSGTTEMAGFLADWPTRSARVRLEGRTSWDGANGWLLTRVGRRERGWGRLVLDAPQPPTQRLIVIAERAAAALVTHRLHDRHRDDVVRRTHHELLLGLLNDPSDAEVLRRCELAGLPVARRHFVGLTVLPLMDGSSGTDVPRSLEEVIASLVNLARQAGVPALVCEMDREVRALLSIPSRGRIGRSTEAITSSLHRRHPVAVCVGRTSEDVTDIDRTLQESHHVASSLGPSTKDRGVHRLEDVHIRGLLTLLGDDDRLTLFSRSELGPLREHDRRHGSDLLAALRALLTHPVSKTEAAGSLHLSRPAFYDRLAKVERLLGCDLDDADTRLSLHVALLADELTTDRARRAR